MALKIIYQVNEEGAYANLALDKALFACKDMDVRDKALVTELVYGSVKMRGQLDYLINQFASVKVKKMDKWTRNILRLSVYQLRFLDKIPPSAAVNEAVKLGKRYGHADKFVNAVLRSYLRGADHLCWPERDKNPKEYCMVQYSFPDWIVERFLKQYGLEHTEQLLDWFNKPSPLWIRTNTLKIKPAELLHILQDAGITAEASTHTPEGICIKSGVQLLQLESFRQGLFTVQDESSMLVALAAEPQKGYRVLDVCSAPGGKSTHMAQLMKNTGTIYACDIHAHRLQLITENCKRLGIHCVTPLLQDGTVLTERFQDPFDVIVCDVPCSGLGVLGRRADARWSKDAMDIPEICGIQRRILEQAAQLVKPGGTLIYSTCTMVPEENQEMVALFLETHPEFTADTTLPDCWLNIQKGSEGYAQFLPFEDKMDGFFIARLQKKEA